MEGFARDPWIIPSMDLCMYSWYNPLGLDAGDRGGEEGGVGNYTKR